MPDLLITRRIKVDGVLTDADVVPVLRDPTSAAGLMRDDSAEVILPAGTPLVHQSAGVYSLLVPGLEPGAYTYWIETTVGGDTTRQEKHYTAAAGDVVETPPPVTIADALTEAALGPASASGDGQSMASHKLTDLIEADKYQANKSAARRRGLPIRMVKLVPPGAADVG